MAQFVGIRYQVSALPSAKETSGQIE